MLVRHPCMALVPNFTRAFPPSELSFSLTGCERYAPIIFCCYSLFRGSSPGSSSSLFLRHESKTNCFPRRRREERSFFFFWDSISLRAPRVGRRRRRTTRRRRPLFCARQFTKAFDRSTETKRSKSCATSRVESFREREWNLNFSPRMRVRIQNDDDKSKENVRQLRSHPLLIFLKSAHQRETKREEFCFFSIKIRRKVIHY